MLKVQCHVGALIELHFDGSPSFLDAQLFKIDTANLVMRIAEKTKRRVTICTDLRAAKLFSPEVCERIISLMRGENLRVERNCIVGGDESALLTLQVRRLLIEATNPGRRRMFAHVPAAVAWLDEVLQPDERARLRRFLESGPAETAPAG